MRSNLTLKVNFTGGVISPGDLLQILNAVRKAGISHISFGLRQQLLVEVPVDDFSKLMADLKPLGLSMEVDADEYPNIISSYPAEEVFITKTWLSEGVYKDIFDSFDYKPRLKINISDSNQSFTPMFTGNINWVASLNQHFWHLSVRFPKTNIIYNWKDIIYTNDIAAVSKKIEQTILQHKDIFHENRLADGSLLYQLVNKEEHFITKPAETELLLPSFSLPYYEGFNKYHDKHWLGIYRRDEQFSVRFLQAICLISLSTKIGQLCSTPWKSLIIKGIEQKDRHLWDEVLGKYQINVRHAANELNFQVEDNCKDGLAVKNYLVKHLNKDDIRTFGVCIGIKTRKKSEVFSSILVRKKSLFTIAGLGFFNLYDILIAKDFNPNERTGKVFSRNNIKLFLPAQLRAAIVTFYHSKAKSQPGLSKIVHKKTETTTPAKHAFFHQCEACLSIYDPELGEPDNGIIPGTSFEKLPISYCCPLCETPKLSFRKIAASSLALKKTTVS